jgi:hypothetical protein
MPLIDCTWVCQSVSFVSWSAASIVVAVPNVEPS